ncbi:Crp/Fnr family transcriptional regulator [Pararhizobium sp.]|uniref:Crp/Fnr family transcriptional regulator n=1 Tax=Pararhizobium sp. TaxID=1977563 RepID=UPI00271A4C84|nr:Crp/Fnr family transcriptional regulator [Pararhizobium sp.]MDO9416702.1 Crp/Fnr family transcriptional regulator [Pararhizobium sp.]
MNGAVSGSKEFITSGADTDTRVQFWRSLPIFSALSEALCLELAAISRRKRWAAGALLFQRGDDSSYMVGVEKGRVRLSLQTSGGREFALRHIGTGALFGEIGILDGSHRSADAMAVVPTWGYVMERCHFLALMDKHPEISTAVVHHLCSLLRYTTEHIETIALYSLEGRIARFLLSQLHLRDEDGPSARPQLLLDLSQSDIADLLGATRSKVNRALSALEAAGAFSRSGKLIICNPDRLLQLADPGSG